MHHESSEQTQRNYDFANRQDWPPHQEAQVLERKACEEGSELSVPSNSIEVDCDSITPQMLSLVELDQREIDTIVQTVPDGARNVQDIYSLSTVQEGMLFHHILNQQSDTYLLATLFELASRQQVDALLHASQSVINRHDSLRTAVLWEALRKPVQVVYRRATLHVEQMTLDAKGGAIEQMKLFMKQRRRRWDLTQAPMMRLCVAKDPHSQMWYGLLQVHHLVCDFRSLRILIAEIVACVDGRERELAEPAPYRDYVAQMKVTAQGAEPFFRSKFGDVDEPTAPFGIVDVHGSGSEIEEARREVSPVLAQGVRTQARRMRVSPARLIHAAWGLVVALTSGREDVVFGTVLSTLRQKTERVNPMLGMAINTLPLRLRLEGITTKELVEQTHCELGELVTHAAAPLTLAQNCSGITGTAPLFTSLLNYRRGASTLEAVGASASGVRVLAWRGVWTNYPIALSVDDVGDGFSLTMQTDLGIDSVRMLGYLETAMCSLVKALEFEPQTPALALSILPDDEQRQVIGLFNSTHADFPRDLPVHELFEQCVVRNPDAVAVVCGDQQLTYVQLNQRANQLAHALVARGVGPDDRVALYTNRSVETVVALLAILKAGGAYVPLDVNYPPERIRHMLRDSAPVVLLSQAHLQEILETNEVAMLAIDAEVGEISAQSTLNLSALKAGSSLSNLAYVVYTSGSTGVPKGVMVEHRNLVNLIHWHCSAFGLREGLRSSAVAALGFDAAGWEIWPPLSVGATLVLAPAGIDNDIESLLDWWKRQSVDIGFLPTPMAEYAFSRDIRIPGLRTLLIGGDRFSQRPASTSFELINNYGPTESTVVATSGKIGDDEPSLHIGRPIANTKIYILNSSRQPVPIGVPGEMYVGGAGVARGYLNQPDLTARHFEADPFGGDPRARMYRTGDIGRWRSDGVIEYLGRNDQQVKIRGYRIELAEIEAQLARLERVKDVAVIVREDRPGEKRVVAYFTKDDSCCHSVEEMRAKLGSILPEYMVPSAFVIMESLPLTPNGKINRRALPAPDIGAYASRAYETPEGQTESALAEIWQELLRVPRVGRDDNFFELGGHSLLVMQAIARIRSALSVQVPMRLLFEFPTLRQVSAQLEDMRQSRLGESISDGGGDIRELLESVASMPEDQVQRMMSRLREASRP